MAALAAHVNIGPMESFKLTGTGSSGFAEAAGAAEYNESDDDQPQQPTSDPVADKKAKQSIDTFAAVAMANKNARIAAEVGPVAPSTPSGAGVSFAANNATPPTAGGGTARGAGGAGVQASYPAAPSTALSAN